MVQTQKKKILLAEDDDSMRRFIEVILQNADYEVFTTEDGLAAMEIGLNNEIDAVVADAIMPNLSGYDLCRMIRTNSSEMKIPCIILSGLKQEDSDDSIENLADVFLLKDTNLKDNLLAALKRLL